MTNSLAGDMLGLVHQGRKEGFVAGVIFTVGIYASAKIYQTFEPPKRKMRP